jgi:hypothetical protein
MPDTAAIVDELRALCGRGLVDAAIRAGLQARREMERVEASQGPEAARRWLAAQRMPAGCFWAEEGGRSVGVKLP